MNLTEKKLSSRSVFSGKIFSVTVDEVELPDKSKSVRECVRHNGGAAVLLVIEGKIALVKQHRYLYGKDIYEIPAGQRAAPRRYARVRGGNGLPRRMPPSAGSLPFTGIYKRSNSYFYRAQRPLCGAKNGRGGVSHLQVFPRGRGCFYDRARGNLRRKDGCGGV